MQFNNSPHMHRRQRLGFGGCGFFGHWFRCQRPFPAAVGDLNRWMKPCALVVFAIIALVAVAGCRRSVQMSGGMAPTIKPGERVTIDYMAYTVEAPRRWDVVAFKPPVPPSNFMVLKRVIALPMETISLTTNGIVVNGNILSMPAALSNVVYCPPEKLPLPTVGLVTFPYRVPPEHYFVIGDNWTNSLDSRYYGAVPVSNILGKVLNK